MKKTLILLFCVLILGGVYSQKKSQQFTIGTYVGFSGSIGGLSIMNPNMRYDNSFDGSSLPFLKAWKGTVGLVYIGRKPRW